MNKSKMSHSKFPTERTISFLLTDSEIILAEKKRGMGTGLYNGYGGKLEHSDKTIEHTAAREIKEESGGILVEIVDLVKMAEIEFYFTSKPEWNQRVHVYFVYRWKGEPTETAEMRPEKFLIANIPYARMWDSDRIWLPKILSGQRIKAKFYWKEDNKTVDKYKIRTI